MPKAEVGTKSRVTHWKSYREKRALCVVDISCFFFEFSFQGKDNIHQYRQMSYLFLPWSIQAWEAVWLLTTMRWLHVRCQGYRSLESDIKIAKNPQDSLAQKCPVVFLGISHHWVTGCWAVGTSLCRAGPSDVGTWWCLKQVSWWLASNDWRRVGPWKWCCK